MKKVRAALRDAMLFFSRFPPLRALMGSSWGANARDPSGIIAKRLNGSFSTNYMCNFPQENSHIALKLKVMSQVGLSDFWVIDEVIYGT